MKKLLYILTSCVTCTSHPSNHENIQKKITHFFGKTTKMPESIVHALDNLIKTEVITKDNFDYLFSKLYEENKKKDIVEIEATLPDLTHIIQVESLEFSIQKMSIE